MGGDSVAAAADWAIPGYAAFMPVDFEAEGLLEDEGNVRERALDAGARLASETHVENGLPPLPHVTPHTMYAQLLDRSKRAHGPAFDALLADAQETLYGAQSGEFSPPSDFGPSAENASTSEIGSDTGETDDGRGGFRTCDLSRVKRALSH